MNQKISKNYIMLLSNQSEFKDYYRICMKLKIKMLGKWALFLIMFKVNKKYFKKQKNKYNYIKKEQKQKLLD